MLAWSHHILTAAPEERDGTDITPLFMYYLSMLPGPGKKIRQTWQKSKKIEEKIAANPAKSAAINLLQSPGLQFLLSNTYWKFLAKLWPIILTLIFARF